MKLTAIELASVRSKGLYITEKCDGCGKLLNQTFRYTIARKPEVYCSVGCRDLAFFGDPPEAKKYSTPGKCVSCRASLEKKNRGPCTVTRFVRNGRLEQEGLNRRRDSK